MKKIISLVLALSLVLIAVPAAFAMGTNSGVNGTISWELGDDGTLTITGTGAVPGYNEWGDGSDLSPWHWYNQSKYYAAERPASGIGHDIVRIVVGEGITSLGNEIFRGCTTLKSVSLPESLTGIGAETFFGCSRLEEINLSKVESIGSYAFGGFESGAALVSVDISNVRYIDRGVFQNCASLKEAVLPAGIESIPGEMFLRCSSLEKVTVPEGITAISYSAFRGCTALRDVSLPSTLRILGSSAFDGCLSLQAVSLPEGLREIGAWAFQNCISIASLTVPSTVNSVGGLAFYGCTALRELVFLGEAPELIEGLCVDRTMPNDPLLTAYYPGGKSWEEIKRNYPLVNWVEGQPSPTTKAVPPEKITAAVAAFDVYVDGIKLEHINTAYPLLVYKDVTYFPMTFDNVHRLGLTNSFDNGAFYLAHSPNTRYSLNPEDWRHAVSHIEGETVGYPVFVNGKRLDNEDEEYPVFNARGITYFPLTWRFATEEFGLDISWDGALHINRRWASLNPAPYEIDGGKVYFCPDADDPEDCYVFDPMAKTVQKNDRVLKSTSVFSLSADGFEVEDQKLWYNGQELDELSNGWTFIRGVVNADDGPYVCIRNSMPYETFTVRGGQLRSLRTGSTGNIELLGSIDGRPVVKATWKSEEEAVSAVNDGYFIVNYDSGFPGGSLRKIYPYVYSDGAFTLNNTLYLLFNRNNTILDTSTGEEVRFER